MSAVVSVMITRITIVIEMIAPTWKVGVPKCRIGGNARMSASPTLEKSALPANAAITVPATSPIRIDRRDSVPWKSRLITRMMTSVRPA